MAITRSTASRVRSGRIGDTVYYTSQGREISRAALNSSNYGKSASRTDAQQTRRVKWANLVNFYKVSKVWMAKAFENKKAGVSDYNMLMKLNVNKSSVALTKDQAASGACVAEPLQVSLGSLQPIELTSHSDATFTSNVRMTIEIDDSTTIAQLTEDLLANNSWLRNNMQISFIVYSQTTDAMNVPRVQCVAYELTLSRTSQDLVNSYMPTAFVNRVAESLGVTDDFNTASCFTFVLSESVNGKTYVSTQTLTSQNSGLIALFSSASQVEAAIASYGVDGTVFLDSGSTPQGQEASKYQITAAVLAGINVIYNGDPVRIADISDKTARILTNFTPTSLSAIELDFVTKDDGLITSSVSNISDAVVGNNNIYTAHLRFAPNTPTDAALYRLRVISAEGTSTFYAMSAPRYPEPAADGE